MRIYNWKAEKNENIFDLSRLKNKIICNIILQISFILAAMSDPFGCLVCNIKHLGNDMKSNMFYILDILTLEDLLGSDVAL